MKNKKASNKSNEKKGDDKLKKENDLINPNEIASISNLWQQYSPMAWSETYNEYINYTRRMTEIYNEYAKSSQLMLISKRFIKIHPSLQKLIVSLRMAIVSDDWKLDKQQTSNVDGL